MRFFKSLVILLLVVLFLDIQPTYGKGGRGGGSRGGSRGGGSRGSSSGSRGSSSSSSSGSHGSSSSSSSSGRNPLERSGSKSGGSQPQPVKPSAPEPPKVKPSAPQLPQGSQNPSQHQPGSSGSVSQVNPPSYGNAATGNAPPHGINQGSPYQGNPPPYGTNPGYPAGNPPPYGTNLGYPAGNPPPYGTNPRYPAGNPPPYGTNPGYPAGNPPPYGSNPGYPAGNPPAYGTNQGYPSGNPPPYGGNTGYNPQAPPPYGFNIPQGAGGVNKPNVPHGAPPHGVYPGSGPHGYVPPSVANSGNLGPGGYPRQPGMVYPPARSGSSDYFGSAPVGGTSFVPHKKKGLLGSLFSLNKGHGKKPKYGGAGAFGASSLGGSRISPVGMMLPAMALGKAAHKPSKFNKSFLLLPLLMYSFSRPRMHFHGFDNNYSGRCFRPRAPGNGTIDCMSSHDGMVCDVRCLEGYVFPDNSTTRPTQCWQYSGHWRPTRYFPGCLASCGTECKNGGSCKTPGLCRCESGFRGNQCEYSVTECDVRKLSKDPKKISWVCSHSQNGTTCAVKCRPPGTFESPIPEKYHCHVNGTWTPDSIPECSQGSETQESIQTSSSSTSVAEDISKDSTEKLNADHIK